MHKREYKGKIGWPDTPAASNKRTEDDVDTKEGSRAKQPSYRETDEGKAKCGRDEIRMYT